MIDKIDEAIKFLKDLIVYGDWQEGGRRTALSALKALKEKDAEIARLKGISIKELEPFGSVEKFKIDFKNKSDEFWKDIIYKDGKIDEKQILLELADHYFMLHEIPIVYEHATGGLLSKQMYFAHAINPVITDYINRSIDEAIQDNIDDGLLIPTEDGEEYWNKPPQ